MNKINAAFFDVDETVINIKSMFSFLQFYLEHGSKEPLVKNMTFQELMDYFKEIGGVHPRSYVNKQYYELFKGVSITHFKSIAEKWFKYMYSNGGVVFYAPVLEHLNIHKENDSFIVFVSGACNEILEPIAKHLGVTHLLGVNLQVENGIITGEIIPPQTIGIGKAEAVSTFIKDKKLSAEHCYAYGDHASDIPMLECVENAFVVGNDTELLNWQRKNNKSHIELEIE